MMKVSKKSSVSISYLLLLSASFYWLIPTNCLLTPTVNDALNQTVFRLLKSPPYGPIRLGPGWSDRSKVACIVSCWERYGHLCTSFLFNSATNLCTPGSVLNVTETLPMETEGDLYASYSCDITFCDISKGFVLWMRGDTCICVGRFLPTMSYTAAEAACEEKGSHLMLVNNYQRLLALRDIFDDEDVWVGCDARNDGVTFRWYGGEAVTSDEVATLFKTGTPGTVQNNELCVEIHDKKGKLSHDACGDLSEYACEISLPQF